MSPWAVVGAAGLLLAAYGAGRWDGARLERESQQRAEETARRATEAALAATAEAISKITVKHQTIRQEVQREIVEKPVYRDCRADPGVLQLYNAAKTGAEPEPVGGSELPGAGPAD